MAPFKRRKPAKQAKRSGPKSDSVGAAVSSANDVHLGVAATSAPQVPEDPGAPVVTEEPEKLDDSPKVVSIMALPEELMLQVLGWLGPSALLGPVPLVCKEWLRLCRLRAAWADSRVVYPGSRHESPFSRRGPVATAAQHGQFLRDVVKAPHVHALNLEPLGGVDHDQPGDPDKDYKEVLKVAYDEDRAVRERRQARITEVALQSLDGVAHLVLGDAFFQWPARLFAVLLKFRDTLHGLKVQLRSGLVEYRRDGQSVLDVIAAMGKLRRLDVAQTQLRPGLYRGELGRGLPALERFGYRDKGRLLANRAPRARRKAGDDFRDGRDTEALVLDVLAGHRDRLRRLDIDFIFPDVTYELAQAMGGCRTLRRVSLDAHNLHHVEGMPDLRTLELNVRKKGDYYGRGERDEDDVAAFIASSEVLPLVEALTITRDAEFTYSRYFREFDFIDDFESPVVAALARRCTGVRRLALSCCCWSDEDYAAVIGGFPGLLDLDLVDRCDPRASTLRAIAASDRHLRLLKLNAADLKSGEARAALQRIRERHPGTAVEVSGAATEENEGD